MKMKAGRLAKCNDTGRVGIIIETKDASWATMALIKWFDSREERWVDTSTLHEA